MPHTPKKAKSSLLRNIYAQLDRKDKLRFLLFLAAAQLPALAELVVAGSIALVAAVFSSPEKVADYAPIAFIIKHTGFTFLYDQRALAFALLITLWLAMLLKNVTTALQAYVGAMFAEHIGRKLTLRLFDFFLHAPWQWHLSKNVVDLQFSVSAAPYTGQFFTALSVLISSASVAFLLFCGLVIVAPSLSAGLFLVAGSSALLAIHGARRYLDKLNNSIYVKQLALSKAAYFALHGMKEAKLHLREDAIYNDYATRSKSLMFELALRTALLRLPVMLIESIAFLMLPAVMYFLLEVQGASMTKVIALMGFLAGAAWRVLPAVNRVVDCSLTLRVCIPYFENILSRLREKHSLAFDAVPQEAVQLDFTEQLHIDQVSYAYPDADSPALAAVDFTIAKGSMTGIVGLSGAGKSSLVAIITGLLQPVSGGLFLDGLRLEPEHTASWMQKIGYVPQSPFIFNDTIAANIALNDWGGAIDRERVLECCKLAALDFLDSLPQGLDTPVGDKGMRLSGGQLQRIAIARALYGNPELLIFDEATSALDMKNERAIHDTVLHLKDRVTMILVAHRLSTVQDCDHIVWLDKGSVAAQGKPETILPAYEQAMKLHSPAQG